MYVIKDEVGKMVGRINLFSIQEPRQASVVTRPLNPHSSRSRSSSSSEEAPAHLLPRKEKEDIAP